MTDGSNVTGTTTHAKFARRWQAFDALPVELKHYLHGAITSFCAADVLQIYHKRGMAYTIALLRAAEAKRFQERNSETRAREWHGQVEPLTPNWSYQTPSPNTNQSHLRPTSQELGL